MEAKTLVKKMKKNFWLGALGLALLLLLVVYLTFSGKVGSATEAGHGLNVLMALIASLLPIAGMMLANQNAKKIGKLEASVEEKLKRYRQVLLLRLLPIDITVLLLVLALLFYGSLLYPVLAVIVWIVRLTHAPAVYKIARELGVEAHSLV